MKMRSLASATVFGLGLLAVPVRADEAPAVKLTPQMQAMLEQLLKSMETEQAEDTTTANPSGGPSAEAGAPASRKKEPQTALRTGSLRTGTLSGTPHLSDEQWRQLFPLRR